MMAATPLHERVVHELTVRVVTGEWPPGYLVPTENELCELLSVSRTVVREAMRLLVDRGLMIVRKGKGTVVARREQWALLDPLILSEGLRHGQPDIARHVMEARRLLEPLVLGLAAERATAEQLVRLERLMEQLRHPADSFDAHLDWGLEFHRVLVEAANNPLLTRMLAPIYAALGLWHGARSIPASLRQTNRDDHERLLAALQARDPAAAAAAATAHLGTVFDVVVRTAVARHERNEEEAVVEPDEDLRSPALLHGRSR